MEFQIKCHLGYEVSAPASFLFNVAVTQNPFQRIITEHFEVRGVEYSQEMARDLASCCVSFSFLLGAEDLPPSRF